MERRLAAIFAADAVGYSRMMREDEPGALALLHKYRSEVIDPGIAKHRGRIVKLMGDGLLAEFSSVVEAVDCAAEIQRAMAARNGGSQGERQMAFRVGVHLGDIIVEGDDLYGDGVNIASRLEGIAERGGICISRQAYDQVQKKLALGYRSLGPKNLKNIPDQIEAFAIQGDGLAIADERQEIRYCRAADSVRYAISGQGPPLVKTGNTPAVPKGSTNLGLIGQYVEIPKDIAFTIEYSVRAAWEAIYVLLKRGPAPLPVYQGQYDPKALFDALRVFVFP